jgi:hypothetical protein
VSVIISAIKADVARLESPGKILLTKYPGYVRRLQEVLDESRGRLREIESGVEGSRREAERMGYL